MAINRLFKRAGLKAEDDNELWDSEKVLAKLHQARTDLKEAQRKHKENHDTGLKKDLDEKEKKARESDDPKAAKKQLLQLRC